MEVKENIFYFGKRLKRISKQGLFMENIGIFTANHNNIL